MPSCVVVDMNLSQRRLQRRLLVVCASLIVCSVGLAMVLVGHRGIQPPLANEPAIFQPQALGHKPSVTVEPGMPTQLRIPKIKVDAAIDEMGLTSGGDLAAPKGPTTAGWYEAGPRPGSTGSSVIDGHYGWVGGKAAIFDDLHMLQRGDMVYTEDKKGVSTGFMVTGSRLYGPNEDDTAVFRSGDGKARLNLITCQGSWNAGQQSYQARLVVFTVKV